MPEKIISVILQIHFSHRLFNKSIAPEPVFNENEPAFPTFQKAAPTAFRGGIIPVPGLYLCPAKPKL